MYDLSFKTFAVNTLSKRQKAILQLLLHSSPCLARSDVLIISAGDAVPALTLMQNALFLTCHLSGCFPCTLDSASMLTLWALLFLFRDLDVAGNLKMLQPQARRLALLEYKSRYAVID
ncbi:hypothetical protein SADUNF_Sadunf12G0099300 [Salix dunnii]|uniref:Uncharacterized protein n=1 Tax=Salix dunnii TaxID=1413687 RepID=A0A835JLH8_9ROSI|nr:hypothetical protein SADUNF_Sadunf12G0099300 [Salix dunnii]